MIKQNWMLYRKTKQCFIISLIVLAIWLGLTVYFFIGQYSLYEGNADLPELLQLSIRYGQYIFIVFLFLSYEYLSQTNKYRVEECINATYTSGVRQRGYQIGILLAVNLFYYICMYLLQIIFCISIHIHLFPYLFYIGKALLIYFLLVNVVAILFGAIVSYLENANFAYAFLVLAGLLSYIRAEQHVKFPKVETLHGFSDFTQIFCPSARWVLNDAYLHPIEMHFWVKPVYFIAFLLIFFFILCFVRTRIKRYLYITVIPFVCGVISVFLWFLPCDGSYAGYADYENQIFANDQKLLSDPEPFDEFYVVRYDMELDLRNILQADVVMTLSDPSLKEYAFTFCGVYPIESIIDGNGNALTYTRDGNRLTVMNDTGNLEEIHMVYESAHLNGYYTGKNGSYLPGNFPYYPIVGTGDIYQGGLCSLPEQESDFRVTLKSNLTVYSNLKEKGKNVFEGHSNQVTFVSGPFWTEKTIDGVVYIFSDISFGYNPERNAYLYEGLQNAFNHDVEDAVIDYTVKDKIILIAPLEFVSNYMFGSDMILISSRLTLERYYTNYLQTGNWYSTEGIMTDQELREWLEENGAGDLLEDDHADEETQDDTEE